jgi:hypothetical protein
MDGGSTIWVPNVPIALPDIPHSACAKAQPASKGCRRVAARARSGACWLILEGALVHGARVGTGQALGALPRVEGCRLVGRGPKPDRGEGQPPPLGIDSRGCDRARVRLSAALSRHAALASNEEVLELARNRGTSSVGRGGARERGRVAVGGHGGRVRVCRCVCVWCCCAGGGSIDSTTKGESVGVQRESKERGGRYCVYKY